VKIRGLPPELRDLLERLSRRGIPVTPLEVARLRHLLGVEGSLCRGDLAGLLTALLCKNDRHRTMFQREYRRWKSDCERALERGAAPPAEEETGGDEPVLAAERDIARRGADGEEAVGGPAAGRRRVVLGVLRRYRWQAAAVLVLATLIPAVWILYPPPSVEKLLEIPPFTSRGGSAPAGSRALFSAA